MNLFRFLIELEENSDLHAARLLVLLKEFAGKEGARKINGLTKLVKLDFLLRYPVYMERALERKGAPREIVEIQEYERRSVESAMIRYHYGPWDPRYRSFINLLVGRGLCEVNVKGRTIFIGLTHKGHGLASKLSENIEFSSITNRARILRKYFDISGGNLKDFIYQTFPEIVSLRLGEVIEYEDQIHSTDASV